MPRGRRWGHTGLPPGWGELLSEGVWGWRETGEGASGEGPFQAKVLSAVSGGRALAPGAPIDVVSVVVTGQTGARLRGSDCQGPNLTPPAVSPVTS